MEKLNKYIKYMVFAMILCVVMTVDVFASCVGETRACKECSYSLNYINETVTIKYKAVDDGNGDINLSSQLTSGKGFEYGENDILGTVFKPTSGNLLYCPTLYYATVAPQGNNTATNVSGGKIKIKVSTTKKTGYAKLTTSDLGGNNIKISDKTKDSVMCEMKVDIKDATGKIIVSGQKLNFNLTEGSLPSKDTTGNYSLTFKDGLSFEDFGSSGVCNYKGYVLCQATKNTSGMPNGSAVNYAPSCTFSKNEIIFSENTQVTEPGKTEQGNNNQTNNNGGGITFGDGTADCQYVLGQILDEAQELFNVIKFLAPMLVIVFGSLDFVKAVVAMDDKGSQMAMKKFPKRLLAAALLFLLPYLINLVLSLPGLEIENAVCGIGMVVFRLW